MGYIHYLVLAFILLKQKPSKSEIAIGGLILLSTLLGTEGKFEFDLQSISICFALSYFTGILNIFVSKEKVAGEKSKINAFDITLAYSLFSLPFNLAICYSHD